MTSQEMFKSITSKHDKMGKAIPMPMFGGLNPTIVANTIIHYKREMETVMNTIGNWDVDLDMGNPMERELAMSVKNAKNEVERDVAMVNIYLYGKINDKLNLGFSHLSPDLAKQVKNRGGFYASLVA